MPGKVSPGRWMLLLSLAGCQPAPIPAGLRAQATDAARYPDLAAMSPATLYLQAENGRIKLRFNNTIANLGPGPLQVRASIQGNRTEAYQEILNEDGQVAQSRYVGSFEYHPSHHHTHVDQVAKYELRQGSPQGPLVLVANKVSYCLQDSVPLGNAGPKLYAQCTPELQGISPGWGDYYGAEIPDQDLDVTDLSPGEYVLAVTVDPKGKFLDANRNNNGAWIGMYLDPARYVLRQGERSDPAW